jgi:adenylylsulfate kinase
MLQHGKNHARGWTGWSTISANNDLSFTIWLTGLPGTGKTTLSKLLKKAIVTRGYKVEIIDTKMLSRWLNLELQISEEIIEDHSHTLGYDAFITHICTILSHNGIICITASVSPYSAARTYAREQIQQFIEVYLHCSDEQRLKRLKQLDAASTLPADLYQPPLAPELSIDTSVDFPELGALRIISFLERHGYLAPLCEDADAEDEEIDIIKARLQAMGYLE